MKETIKSFFRFFISRRFLLHVALACLIVGLIVWGVLKLIGNSTNHGQKLPVPDFTGVHMDDLDEFVKKYSLNYEIQDSITIEGKEKGTVLSQDPGPTDSTQLYVKEGRKVYLTVVSSQTKLVTIPNFLFKPPRMIEALTGQYNLKYQTKYDRTSKYNNRFVLDVTYKGKSIYKQEKNIKTGEMESVQVIKKVPVGSKLVIIFSWGKPENVAVPDLEFLTVRQAQEKLMSLGLNLQPTYIGRYNSKADSLSARVSFQQTEVSSLVNIGSNIKVTVER